MVNLRICNAIKDAEVVNTQFCGKEHGVSQCIKCFSSLKMRSHCAKVEFAGKQRNSALIALIIALAYDYLKITETIKASSSLISDGLRNLN